LGEQLSITIEAVESQSKVTLWIREAGLFRRPAADRGLVAVIGTFTDPGHETETGSDGENLFTKQ
jgi:hypothetical protein